MSEQDTKSPFKTKMAIAFVAMVVLIGFGLGWSLALNIVFIVVAVVMNGIVTIALISRVKDGTAFFQSFKIAAVIALALDAVAFIYMGNLILILTAGVGAPAAINLAIYIEDKVKRKK